ncbi:hypothetical protein [Rubritalea sp.]
MIALISPMTLRLMHGNWTNQLIELQVNIKVLLHAEFRSLLDFLDHAT